MPLQRDGERETHDEDLVAARQRPKVHRGKVRVSRTTFGAYGQTWLGRRRLSAAVDVQGYISRSDRPRSAKRETG